MKRFIIVAAAIILSCGALSAQNKGDIYFGGMTGLAIQAVGANPNFAKASGINADKMRIKGVAMSALVRHHASAMREGHLQTARGIKALAVQL